MLEVGQLLMYAGTSRTRLYLPPKLNNYISVTPKSVIFFEVINFCSDNWFEVLVIDQSDNTYFGLINPYDFEQNHPGISKWADSIKAKVYEATFTSYV